MSLGSGKTLSSKVSLFFAVISVVLVVVLAATSLYAFRKFSINVATEHLRTAAEITRVHLTDAMIIGVIEHRQQFLQRLTEVHGLRSARVVRSPLVDIQFGKTPKGEYTPDEVEKEVLQTGKSVFLVTETSDDMIFRGTIPYVASSEGYPNCLQCHQVKVGEVLGAVTLSMSITNLLHNAVLSVAGIITIVILCILVLFVLLNSLLRPISSTAAAVADVVETAVNGNFKGYVEKHTENEIGQIADNMNRLLKFLDEGLNRIGEHVGQLTNRKPGQGENLLSATIEMVEHLTQISHYKLAIEEDETKIDVYRRLMSSLQERFGQFEFSVYEISQDKNSVKVLIVDGEQYAPCRWCDEQILTKPGSCRVIHTGHTVNGVVQPSICYAFKTSPDDTERRTPICFPIFQSGSVGSVIQLVVKESEKSRLQTVLPYINVYLRETSPVLEARRLMETLRESSLRDPMTGLYNRRFLEESVDNLIATIRRSQSPMSILMLDLDHFKMVNDTYGHDAGDTVLKELVSVIKRTVRSSDVIVRYGGEEFLVLLRDTSGDDSERVAENIRLAVEKMHINYGGIVLRKTISIGLSDFPIDSNTFWQAVKFADVALYNAKETGRNRVVRFMPEMWEDPDEY